MKNSFLKIAFLLSFCTYFQSHYVAAQTSSTSWYYVVESNTKIKKNSVVRFYNNHHQLVYEEKVTDRNLDLRKPRHKKLLDKALQQVQETPPTLAILSSKKLK